MIKIELVDAASFINEASSILSAAWPPPALRYTPEYVAWQTGFPSPVAMPAAVAFVDNEPVGFGGMSARRFRCGSREWDSAIASFVAVKPGQHPATAVALYREFFRAIRALEIPIVTFGVQGGIGPRIFLRAYAEAGMKSREISLHTGYGLKVDPRSTPAQEYRVEESRDFATLSDLATACSETQGAIVNSPSSDQFEHYFRDPRPRALLVVRNNSTEAVAGAAWVVRMQFTTTSGVEETIALDGVFVPCGNVDALVALFHGAAAWSGATKPVVVTAPNLSGFGSAALHNAHIRATRSRFVSYVCAATLPDDLANASTINVEIV